MGFTWSSIDFEKSTIQVKEASQYLPDRGTFRKTLKTKTSYRKMTLPQTVIDLLKKYKTWYNEERLKAGDQWNEIDRLFVKWNGEPMFTYTPSNWFSKFIERNNLPRITLHGLRHTNAALLLSEGLDLLAVSRRLGHVRASTTTDIYGHALASKDKIAADTLKSILVKNNAASKKLV